MRTTLFMVWLIAMIAISGCTTPQTDSKLPPAIQNYNEQLAPKKISQQDLASGNVHETSLKFTGMTCPSCALGVEYELKQLNGVYDATIQYSESTGLVVYDASQLSPEDVAAGSTVYPATVLSDKQYEP